MRLQSSEMLEGNQPPLPARLAVRGLSFLIQTGSCTILNKMKEATLLPGRSQYCQGQKQGVWKENPAQERPGKTHPEQSS